MKLLFRSLCAILLMLSTSAFAINLADAKKQGKIGELYSGYIGYVTPPTAEIKTLVKATNQKRKVRYKEIAAKRKVSITEVQVIAAKSAFKKTLKGNYIKPKGKDWTKK